MCSVLIFAKPDNNHSDPKLDWQKFKRGDVIDMKDDDNFFWGNDIHGANGPGWWRVVILPGVRVSEIKSLMSSEVLKYPALDTAPRKIRAIKIDLDAIEAEEQIKKGRPLVKTDTASHTKASLLLKMETKPETKQEDVALVPQVK